MHINDDQFEKMVRWLEEEIKTLETEMGAWAQLSADDNPFRFQKGRMVGYQTVLDRIQTCVLG